MTAFRALLVAVGLVSLLTGSTMWAKHAMAAPITVVRPHVDSTAVLDNVVKSGTVHDDDWAEPRVDLNGNEIDDAVGDYRVDPRGEMYERHAPDTVLPRLGAPQM